MKKTLTLIAVMLAMPVFAALQMVDISTLTTNTVIHVVSPGIMFTNNFATNVWLHYITEDTNALQIGDSPYQAFTKANANFLQVTNIANWVYSNNPSGYVTASITNGLGGGSGAGITNLVATNATLPSVSGNIGFIPTNSSTGGSGTTNFTLTGFVQNWTTNNQLSTAGTNTVNLLITNLAIANQNGFGTNTTLMSGVSLTTTNLSAIGDTWLNNSNLHIYVQKVDYDHLNNFVPAMSSDSSPAGVVSASVSSSTAYQAFDGNPLDTWNSGTLGGGQWIQYQFTNATLVNVYAFYQNGITTFAKDWTLSGSQDGATFTLLDTRAGYSILLPGSNVFPITNTTAYLYYRVNITAANSAIYCTISGIKFGFQFPVNVINSDYTLELLSTNTTASSIISLIPFMTSSTTPSGTVTSGGDSYSNPNYFAFESDYRGPAVNGLYWMVGSASAASIGYQFASPVWFNSCITYASFSGVYTNSVIFDISTDGINWTNLWTDSLYTGTGNAYLTNTFPMTLASYVRWTFPTNASFMGISAQVYGYKPGASGGVTINTNSSGGFALNILGGVNVSDNYYINGIPIGGISQPPTPIAGLNQLYVTNWGAGAFANINGIYTLVGGPSSILFTNFNGAFIQTATVSGLDPTTYQYYSFPVFYIAYPGFSFTNLTLTGTYGSFSGGGTNTPVVSYLSNAPPFSPSRYLLAGAGGNKDGGISTNLLTYAHGVVIGNLVCNQLYTNGNFQASLIGGIALSSAVATAANVTFISTTGTITNWPFQTGLGIVQTDILGMNIPIDPNQIFYLTNYSQGSLTNCNLIR